MSELIAEGRYNAVAVPVDTDEGPVYTQFGYTKEDVRQVVVNFEILDGEYPSEYVGQRLAWFGYFKSGKSSIIAMKALRVCGFKGEDLQTIYDQELNNKVVIVVQHDEYEGKVRARIAWVNDPRGGNGFVLAKPMDKAGLRKFGAEMKKLVRETPEVEGEKAGRNGTPLIPPSAPNPSQGAATQDDDIPF